MKVIIPVDEPSPTSPVCPSFGRSAVLCAARTAGSASSKIRAPRPGGAGLDAAQAAAGQRPGARHRPLRRERRPGPQRGHGAIYKAAEGSAPR